MKINQLLRFLLYLAPWLLAACSSSHGVYPVQYQSHQAEVRTTVDSEIAKYYLEGATPMHNSAQVELDTQIAKFHAELLASKTPTLTLQHISEETSVDFATLLYADHLNNQPKNKNFQSRYLRNLDQANSDSLENISAYIRRNTCFLLVPGWDYKTTGFLTGADFRVQRKLFQELGLTFVFAEIPPNGGLLENLAATQQAMELCPKPRKIILVGASAAGPVIHRLIALDTARHSEIKRAAPSRIVAWVNIGGVLKGSPLIDQYGGFPIGVLARPIIPLLGWDFQKLRTFSRSHLHEKQVGPLPQSLVVVNFVGFALSGEVSNFGRDKYPLLRHLGPNDGFSLLPDMILKEGVTYVSRGNDHFIGEDPHFRELSLALIYSVLEMIEDQSLIEPIYRFESAVN